MTKSTVTWVFVGGVIAIVAGVVLGAVAVLAGLASGVIEIEGSEVVGINGGSLVWTLVGLVIGVVAVTGGSLAILVSWIGALLNTAQLQDKTWFALLLVLGLFSFGFIAMLAYVVAGPDATQTPASLRDGTEAAPV